MPNAASHNNASWYTDTDGSLEHSLSRGKPVVQCVFSPEDNSGFLGSTLVHVKLSELCLTHGKNSINVKLYHLISYDNE